MSPDLPIKKLPYKEVYEINKNYGHELLIPPVYKTGVGYRNEGSDGEFVIGAASDPELSPEEIAARPQTLRGVPVVYKFYPAIRQSARPAFRGE